MLKDHCRCLHLWSLTGWQLRTGQQYSTVGWVAVARTGVAQTGDADDASPAVAPPAASPPSLARQTTSADDTACHRMLASRCRRAAAAASTEPCAGTRCSSPELHSVMHLSPPLPCPQIIAVFSLGLRLPPQKDNLYVLLRMQRCQQ